MKHGILFIALLVGSLSFSQSKKDLQDKINQQQTTIDSLKKVIANQENIIENRDRSIGILNEDLKKVQEELQAETDLRREKHAMIQKLRKRSSTGEAKIYYMSNIKNVLKVPAGKYWIVNQFMSDYTASVSQDSLGNTITEEVHVYLQELNGTVLTNPAEKMYGPKLFSSMHPEQVIPFPLVFTEGTQFKIVVFKGEVGALYPYDGKVYFSYTEKDKV